MKETLKRASRTFFQAAAGYIVANLSYVLAKGTDDYNVLANSLLCLAVSGIAAGLAALMNLPQKAGENPYEEKDR